MIEALQNVASWVLEHARLIMLCCFATGVVVLALGALLIAMTDVD